MKKVDIVIKHGTLVTMNKKREIIMDGAVAVQGDQICAIGKTAEIEAEYEGVREIDAKGKVVMPGLINSHVHVAQTFARTICDLDHPDTVRKVKAAEEMGNTAAWAERAWKVDAGLTDEEAYVSAIVAGLEMIRTGTTAFSDAAAFNVPTLAQAVGDLGLRAVLAKNTSDIRDVGMPLPDHMVIKAEDEIRVSEELYQKLNGAQDGRIHIGMGLHAFWACSDVLCKGIGELAKKYDTTLQMHLTQSEGEIPYSINQRGGKRPVAHMRDLGCLGPKFGAIHSAYLNNEDVSTYKELGVNVIHCPTAAMK